MNESNPVHLLAKPSLHGHLVFLLLTLLAFPLSFLSAGFPNFFYEDDAYFYMKIGSNLAHGISSFDGLHSTNGYHPLWAWILACLSAPLACLADPHPLLQVFLVTLLSLSLIWCLHRLSRAPLCCLPVFLVVSFYCGLTMETTLLCLLTAFLQQALLTQSLPPAVLAALSLFIVLCRIDFFFVPLILAAGQAWDRRQLAGSGRFAAAVFIGTLAGLSANIGVQVLAFGEPWTISSFIKAQSALHDPLTAKLLANVSGAGNQIRYLLICIIYSAAFIGAWRRHRPDLLCLLAGSLLFTVVHSFASFMRDWYFAPALLLGLYALWQVTPPRLLKPLLMTSAATALLTPAGFYLVRARQDWQQTRQFIAMVNVIPDHRPIFQVDGSGFTGFWLRAPVINGDGLVNSFDYARRYLIPNRVHEFLKDEAISRIIINQKSPDGNFDFRGLHLQEADLSPQAAIPEARNPFCYFRLLQIPPHAQSHAH